MNVSQAMRRIAALKGAIKAKRARAAACLTYAEASPPAFDFATLEREIFEAVEELTKLKARLRLTNAETFVPYFDRRITVTEATARLAELKSELEWVSSLTSAAQPRYAVKTREYDENTGRFAVGETQMVCALPEAEKVAHLEALAARFAELNDAVESSNNTTELRAL